MGRYFDATGLSRRFLVPGRAVRICAGRGPSVKESMLNAYVTWRPMSRGGPCGHHWEPRHPH
eukprot:9008100-Alexandrium_andersonii.AAC.1